MKKTIEQIRAELDELNKQMEKKKHVHDTVLISNNRLKGKKRPEHSEKMKGRVNPELSKRMKENNPMKGKVSPNRGKSMPQISEKVKGKKKPEGFGEKISKVRKSMNLSNAWAGKKRPEHSILMKSRPNKGLEKTRVAWKCPHCGKEGVGSSNYIRWHGDNCKHGPK